jgi:hypothetical protein
VADHLPMVPGHKNWDSPPAATAGTWRRNEGRYYHERKLAILLLGGIAVAFYLVLLRDTAWAWTEMKWCLAGFLLHPIGTLSLAVLILAFESLLSRRPKPSDDALIDRPQMAPGLFLWNWLALAVIVVCAVPIIGAWGFALWFRLG